MPYVETVEVEHIDLKTFATFVRKTSPRLLKVLTGPEGRKPVWEGLMDLVKEIGYPNEIKKTDKVADTLRALMPYVEAYREAVDSGEPMEDDGAISLL